MVYGRLGLDGAGRRGPKRRAAFAGYQINDEIMRAAKQDAMVLHCLPRTEARRLPPRCSRRMRRRFSRRREPPARPKGCPCQADARLKGFRRPRVAFAGSGPAWGWELMPRCCGPILPCGG